MNYNDDDDFKDFEQASANDILALLGEISKEECEYYMKLPDRDDTDSEK